MEAAIRIIIYSNLVPFLALIFFIILIFINPIFDKKQARLFLTIALLNLILIIAVSINYICARVGWDYAWILRRMTSFLNFAVSPVIPLLLYLIFTRKKHYLGLYLPIVLNSLLCFASIFTGIIFSINTQNKYGRGSLFLIPFITTIGYLLIIILKPNKSRLTSKRIERFFLMGIIGALSLMMVLEIVYSFNFLTWNVSIMGTVMYYLLLNIYQAIVDPLTGVYNRQMYAKELESLENKKRGIIALVDINNFKEINDKYGHDAGDKYLIKFAETLNISFIGYATLYRIGGDEFVLIAKNNNLEQFEEVLAKARENAQNNQMKFACGYKVCERDKAIEETLKEVDLLMYENKKQMKERMTAEA